MWATLLRGDFLSGAREASDLLERSIFSGSTIARLKTGHKGPGRLHQRFPGPIHLMLAKGWGEDASQSILLPHSMGLSILIGQYQLRPMKDRRTQVTQFSISGSLK